ncbi:hypothetical protein [Agathobacter ruminis]|uniref:Uncharacterized protein n=1 Tax=Agathobacter ruminis TaxID=1712665 RepID=A0A2G3E6I7_9FIRM|nr:hypothetical protein [Agathobacter ruminis]MDC7301727.1 hypothetical protein [Agathobacter ruminis]PHU38854.1 hypothetical protein CSX02_00680 [Agathobacter ruminis]
MVKKLVKLGVVFALSISFLCYNAVPTYAAYTTDTWNLRYVKGGLASDSIWQWSEDVTTNETSTVMTTTRVTDGAEVHLYCSSGIDAYADHSGIYVSAPAKKGRNIFAKVTFKKNGNRTNYPKGTFKY